MSGAPSGWRGGIGALLFLATLGGVAVYVQRQAVPEGHEIVRRTAAALPEPTVEEAPPSLPWQDRLNLAGAVPIGLEPTTPPSAPPAAGKAPTPTPPAPTPAPGTARAVDRARARLVQDLGDGHRILLTLDPVLQDGVLEIFRSREVPYAAAVALDVRDGSVLVFAGHSSMDREVDPVEILTTAWAPAASTFKLATTAALLEGGQVEPTTRVCFSGGLHGFDADALRDDPARDVECSNLGEAVAHSHNLVLAKLAMRHLHGDDLVRAARWLRWDQEIPFELPIERSPAHVPAEGPELAQVAAGFWNVDLSPVHGAVVAAILARRGMFQAPHLIAQVVGPDGSDLTPTSVAPERVLNKRIAEQIGEMMVMTTTVGTAAASFRDPGGGAGAGVEVAGKTGSLTGRRAPALNYNWFIGFAPAEQPEIAFAVLLANEPKWRIKAHYVGRRLVQMHRERRTEWHKLRHARLRNQAGASVLVERDPSGAVVAEQSSEAPARPGPTLARAQEETEAAPTLPPVPGPLPAAGIRP